MSYKTISLRTEDDCPISLHKFSLDDKTSKSPVLLVHGYAANGHMWNPPTQDGHLAAFLARKGYIVYAIDLRWRQGRPHRDWNTDDYVLFDIPTAINFMEKDTGRSGVHWIGHSMGGLLGYMYQALNGSANIVSHTVLGSPGFVGAGSHAHLVKLSKAFIKIASLASNTGRLDRLPPQIMASLVAMNFFAANPTNPFIKKYHFSEFQTKNFLGNVSYGESMQMTYLASTKGLVSPHYLFNYSDLASNIESPLLAIAGDRDFVVPPKLVKKGFDAVGTKHKRYLRLGKSRGCLTSYGHLDLIMGPNCDKEVWPKILSWVEYWQQHRHPQKSEVKPFLVGTSERQAQGSSA